MDDLLYRFNKMERTTFVSSVAVVHGHLKQRLHSYVYSAITKLHNCTDSSIYLDAYTFIKTIVLLYASCEILYCCQHCVRDAVLL